MNKKIILGMLALILAFGMMVAGCGGDSGAPAEIGNLPSFEGSAVASQEEAEMLAYYAESAINSAIIAAIADAGFVDIPDFQVSPRSSFIPPQYANINESGSHYYDGVNVTYSIVTTGNFPSSPYTITASYVANINGIYNGVKIAGNGLSVNTEFSVPNDNSMTIKTTYNTAYTVSYQGMGMKVVSNGTVEISINVSSSFTYVFTSANMSYTVYDNSNNVLFSFDIDDDDDGSF